MKELIAAVIEKQDRGGNDPEEIHILIREPPAVISKQRADKRQADN